MASILDICDLSLERDGRLLMQDLSFSVDRGTVLRIEGPNGAGKTSLLRVLAGLYCAYEGALLFHGRPLNHTVRNLLRRQSLYLGHNAGLKMTLTARENLRWLAALQCLQVPDGDIESALDRVGLTGFEDMPCRHLSAGQQRRVALARLFLCPAKLWMLDEPFTALDKQAVRDLEGWISKFAADGGAVILTTHHEMTAVPALRSLLLGERA